MEYNLKIQWENVAVPMSSYFSIDNPSCNRVIHIIRFADFPFMYKYRESLQIFQVIDTGFYSEIFLLGSLPDTAEGRLTEEPTSDILKPHTRQISRVEMKNVKIVRHAYKRKKILENWGFFFPINW